MPGSSLLTNAACALALLAATGCATYQCQPLAVRETMLPGQPTYVAIATDGEAGSEVAPGSGAKLSALLGQALGAHASELQMAETSEPVETAVANAKQRGASYVIVPSILRWGTGPGDSGKGKVSFWLDVYRVADGEQILCALMTGAGSGWSLLLGEPRPVDLADDLLVRRLGELYQAGK